jgi:uncharacterized protein (DUF1778 family)
MAGLEFERVNVQVEGCRDHGERLLADRDRFALPAERWHAFTTALDRSAQADPALVKLFCRPRPE